MNDNERFIQLIVPKLEQDIGFCFHWVDSESWYAAFNQTIDWGIESLTESIRDAIRISRQTLVSLLLKDYFHSLGLNPVFRYIMDNNMEPMDRVTNPFIQEQRQRLSNRVLDELPKSYSHITDRYGINFGEHQNIKLLICSPLAVAESIMAKAEKSIWSNDKFVGRIRRNIQYAKYISPVLYDKLLLHGLSYPNFKQ